MNISGLLVKISDLVDLYLLGKDNFFVESLSGEIIRVHRKFRFTK